MNFRRQGSGPPVVLIHGVGHHWQGWRPVIDLLARDFDVIAVDLPGFGRSAPLPARIDPTIPAYADAVGHLLEDMGVRRPHVAGNSMGGAIALELALREFAASVTAFSPAGFWSTLERRYCQLSLGALARTPSALRPAVLRLARSGNGRRVVFAQLMAAPTRVPGWEAVSALADAWGGAKLHRGARRVRQLRVLWVGCDAARCADHHRLGQARLAAALPATSSPGQATAALRRASDPGHRPPPLL
jgi:pimeloyl-ACP methyl ester carboxylesterase